MGHTREELILDITKLQERRQNLRVSERDIVNNTKLIDMQPVVSGEGNLRTSLERMLPKHLVPTNTGSLRQVLTPFWYRVIFDLGTNPTITANFTQSQSFQVSQDAGFLLTKISRYWKDQGEAGMGAPLGVSIRDNQSTRQFNDNPIPLQNIGFRGRPSLLHTPLLIVPYGSFKMTLTSLITTPAAWDWALVGNGYQELMFGGYRIDMGDERYLTENILL